MITSASNTRDAITINAIPQLGTTSLVAEVDEVADGSVTAASATACEGHVIRTADEIWQLP